MNTKQQSQKEIISLLTNNLTDMYDKGALYGSQSILLAVTEKLKQHVALSNCPENIIPGIVESIKFLDSILAGKPYQLKVSEELNQPQNELKHNNKLNKKTVSEKTLNA